MSTVTKADPATPAGSARPLSQATAARRPGLRAGSRSLAGLLVLVILVLIAVSTAQQSTSWFTTAGWSGIFSTVWNPATNQFGVMAFLYGTVITSVIAIIIAVPVSVSIALLLTEVVPRRWSQPIVYVIDLLAVVPSVVWGLWGLIVLAPWLETNIYTPIASGVNGIPVLDSLFGQPTAGAVVLHRRHRPGHHDHRRSSPRCRARSSRPCRRRTRRARTRSAPPAGR